MNINLLKTKDISSIKTKCLVIGITKNNKLLDNANFINKKTSSKITDIFKKGLITGEIGSFLLLSDIKGVEAENILLVGCDKENSELKEKDFNKIIQTALQALKSTNITEATFAINDLSLANRDIYWNVRFAIETIYEHVYSFSDFKKEKDPKILLSDVTLSVSDKEYKRSEQAKIEALIIAKTVANVKDLINLPPNICNPKYLANKATELGKEDKKVKTTIIDEKEMKKLGMNAYLAVSSGSANQAYMSILTYNNNPDKKAKPIVLVGKGITFDSGGISIKPSANMDEMKCDMSGAATVYGVIQAVAKLKLPINIIGVMAACENLPDGLAYRPGDIITSMNGLSIEILSTDAEGRMVLCDALTYVERFEPELVIDIATLTGACMLALGYHNSGLMTTDEKLAEDLTTAAKDSQDGLWRLPLTDEYYEQIKSNFADLANVGQNYAGATTAACFLSKFTTKYRWAHLDIAGTAWKTGGAKGGTGRPVKLLMQFLLNIVK